jgi:hypothetical protein
MLSVIAVVLSLVGSVWAAIKYSQNRDLKLFLQNLLFLAIMMFGTLYALLGH